MQAARHNIWVACKGDGPLAENTLSVGAAEGEDPGQVLRVCNRIGVPFVVIRCDAFNGFFHNNAIRSDRFGCTE